MLVATMAVVATTVVVVVLRGREARGGNMVFTELLARVTSGRPAFATLPL